MMNDEFVSVTNLKSMLEGGLDLHNKVLILFAQFKYDKIA